MKSSQVNQNKGFFTHMLSIYLCLTFICKIICFTSCACRVNSMQIRLLILAVYVYLTAVICRYLPKIRHIIALYTKMSNSADLRGQIACNAICFTFNLNSYLTQFRCSSEQSFKWLFGIFKSLFLR